MQVATIISRSANCTRLMRAIWATENGPCQWIWRHGHQASSGKLNLNLRPRGTAGVTVTGVAGCALRLDFTGRLLALASRLSASSLVPRGPGCAPASIATHRAGPGASCTAAPVGPLTGSSGKVPQWTRTVPFPGGPSVRGLPGHWQPTTTAPLLAPAVAAPAAACADITGIRAPTVFFGEQIY